MTATSPVNAIQYPDLTNDPDQVAQFATMNTNIDTSVVPRFANASARNAAVVSPIEGQICYLTQEKIYTYYSGATYGWITAEMQRLVPKILNESISAATTANNSDDVLYFYAQANSTYIFELYGIYTGSTTVDAIIGTWSIPAGATIRRGALCPGTGQTNRASYTVTLRGRPATQTVQAGTHSTAGVGPFLYEGGTLTTGSTPGIVQWVWAKPTAYAETLTVGGTSYLTYRKIS